MGKAERPAEIDHLFDKTKNFVEKIAPIIPLGSAILDDWNAGCDKDGEKIKGARIIYGSPYAENCGGKSIAECADCPVYKTVGIDNPNEKTDCRTTLCAAAPEHLALLSAKQPFLNCKTLEQYLQAFSEYFIGVCYSEELLDAELDWVKGFRILWLKGVDGLPELLKKERGAKKRLIEGIIGQLRASGDTDRERIIIRLAKAKSLA